MSCPNLTTGTLVTCPNLTTGTLISCPNLTTGTLISCPNLTTGTLVTCPNFYLHAPARTDPSAAPPGCDSLMVLLPVANMQQMGAARVGVEMDYSGLVQVG